MTVQQHVQQQSYGNYQVTTAINSSPVHSSPRHEDVDMRLRGLAAHVHQGRHVLRRLGDLGAQPQSCVEHHLIYVIISHQRLSVAKERGEEGEPEVGGGKDGKGGGAGGEGGTLVVGAHPATVIVFGVHEDIGRAVKQTSTFSEHWT